MTDQIDFTISLELAENPEPRCPCLLILDISGSMRGAPIEALNDGLVQFKDELASDSLAMQRVEIGIVTFGPAEIHTPFTTANAFMPPVLTARGDTPMGEAIRLGLEMLEARKEEYKAAGLGRFKPWCLLVTDGGPTDDWQHAAALVRDYEARHKVAFFAVGVEGARMDVLSQISVREPLKLQGLKFRELFVWLSASMKSVSQSSPGTEVAPDLSSRLGQRVMWECVSAVAIGTAHIESGGVCQDRCSSRVFDQEGTTWAAVFVSDGAGSALYGELGAEIAVNTANETVTQLMQLAVIPLDESLAIQIISDIRQSIFLAAERENQPTRSFACTFLGAISSPYGAIVFQIGDGGIVVDPGTGLELSIEPMKGPYSNMTSFATDVDSIQRLAVKTYPAGLKSMTLFSDGLERLALDVAENRPHLPFFEPILRKVAGLDDATRPQLSTALHSFLSSDRINERTDDDKSLAIAVLRS